MVYAVKEFANWIEDRIHVHQYYRVPELNDNNQENLFYRKVYAYLNSLPSVEDSDFANLFSGKKSNDVVLCLNDDQIVYDSFLGSRISWRNCERTFVLKIKKKDKRRILRPYLQHIHTVFDDIELRWKEIKLFVNTQQNDSSSNGRWRSVPFTHPSTLETIAMDPDLKTKVKSDLENFVKSKQYYHRLGRVMRRSYLLYGPSGTGKSSFISAMAKFLSYDVYDVDMSRVSDDADLKMLLLQTTSKSVIVVEDLDRFLTEKSTGVSLSGLLNFMDGIVNSCCGDEKVMVFTMNSKEQIDQSILRPGRIDVHIHFPLCNFDSFKTLANNYLGLKDHKLFPQVEEIFLTGAAMSPAEIGEIMIMNRNSPSRALKSVITALQVNGDSRAAALKSVRRLSESSTSMESVSGSGIENVPAMKEIRKLYGLLRLKSSKKLEPLDPQPSPLIER